MAVQWVVKASKLCNLRCKYCYEFPFLADPSRISQQQLRSFFTNVATYFSERPTLRTSFGTEVSLYFSVVRILRTHSLRKKKSSTQPVFPIRTLFRQISIGLEIMTYHFFASLIILEFQSIFLVINV